MVPPTSKFNTVHSVLFHKNGGVNVAVKNFMSHFSMFVSTKSTMEPANGYTVHAQGIGIILCHFPNCFIICTVLPVYYCTYHPFNTISSGALKFHVGFKKFLLNLLNIVTLSTLKVVLGDQPTRLKTILTIFKCKLVKINPKRNRNIFVPTVYDILKKSLSLIICILVISLFTDQNECQEKDSWKSSHKIF